MAGAGHKRAVKAEPRTGGRQVVFPVAHFQIRLTEHSEGDVTFALIADDEVGTRVPELFSGHVSDNMAAQFQDIADHLGALKGQGE